MGERRDEIKKLSAERWELVETAQDVSVQGNFCSGMLHQGESSCPCNYLDSHGEWVKVPKETEGNKADVNKQCLEYMTLCASWSKDSFFAPVLQLAVLFEAADTWADLLSAFPEAANIEKTNRLRLKDSRYQLLHDSDVSFSGQYIHVKLAPI